MRLAVEFLMCFFVASTAHVCIHFDIQFLEPLKTLETRVLATLLELLGVKIPPARVCAGAKKDWVGCFAVV